MSDVIVVCDTENVEIGLPCITYSLRGIVELKVEVQSATTPVHSGMAGGMLADAAIALNVILARLYWRQQARLPVPGFYDKVRKLTAAEKRAIPQARPATRRSGAATSASSTASTWACENKHPSERATWRKPSVTVIAQEASSIKREIEPGAAVGRAIVSCRIVPDQEPEEVFEQLKAVLTKDPPWGVKVTVKPTAPMKWWMTDPTGPGLRPRP